MGGNELSLLNRCNEIPSGFHYISSDHSNVLDPLGLRTSAGLANAKPFAEPA